MGHKLTLYVRSPSKVPKDISDNENVTIIQGTLEDEEGLKKAATSGASIFVSFAGPTYGSKGTACLIPYLFLANIWISFDEHTS
jgi:hypothetical protein